MLQPVADQLVEAVIITASPAGSVNELSVNAPAELAPIKTLLETIRWSYIDTVARCILDRTGFGNELAEFDFGADLEPDEEPFAGVRVSDPAGIVVIDGGAFNRLMLRYFTVATEILPKHRPALAADPRWQEFIQIVEQLKGQAS